MKIESTYSHLNGEEYLMVHHMDLWKEVKNIISGVNANSCKTKVSQEKTMKGRLLYSPGDMNLAFKDGFEKAGWEERRNTFWVTSDEKILRSVYDQPPDEQKSKILSSGQTPIMS